jgi:hypothetical protein
LTEIACSTVPSLAGAPGAAAAPDALDAAAAFDAAEAGADGAAGAVAGGATWASAATLNSPKPAASAPSGSNRCEGGRGSEVTSGRSREGRGTCFPFGEKHGLAAAGWCENWR